MHTTQITDTIDAEFEIDITETHHFALGAFSACGGFESDPHASEGPCLWCGWLVEDHEAHESIAAVIELPRRRDLATPTRRAS